MNTFKYINGSLHCEGVDLSLIGERYATPSYVYSKKTIEENAKAYVNSFTNSRNLACFAVKSLSNLSILKIIKGSMISKLINDENSLVQLTILSLAKKLEIINGIRSIDHHNKLKQEGLLL